MSKIKTAKYKLSRRMGKAVWGSAKDPVSKGKTYPPGQHGPALGAFRRSTAFGTQLRAKQLLKGYYGNINEKQFRKIYQKATRLKGDTGENLIGLLERRLDMIIYRSNFVPTVFAARQFISHKHILVNGQKVNIPSYQISIGDVIEVKEKSRQLNLVVESMQKKERGVPDYYEIDEKAHQVKLTRIPELADVPYPVIMEPHLVVEFYSR
ncbi:MAG: 30S ribosomal protein S4 [Rickettsiales bacterium]|nr:30S ribosomal protein S4 [Rickettsiales bacterium]